MPVLAGRRREINGDAAGYVAAPSRAYWAGPLPRVTVAWWDRPDASSQSTCTLSPGRYCWIRVVSVAGEPTVFPATAVMVSPSVRPTWAAGPPGMALCRVAPEPATLVALMRTPRKAVVPMWTDAVDCPDSIWRAMERAWLIGMAKPCPPDVWNEKPAEAAVSIPMT